MRQGIKSLIAVAMAFAAAGAAFPAMPAAHAVTYPQTSGSFRVLSYNVAGLPEPLSSSNPKRYTAQISPKLNAYDLVSVQEDFAYHEDLVSKLTFPNQTKTSGNVPLGDGMNFFSNFPLEDVTRTKWEDSYGFITDGADQMTPKGILSASAQIAPGYSIDIYDLHADAGTDQGSLKARQSNFRQLGELIAARSKGKAVIVLGDTNGRYTRVEDDFTPVVDQCGLTDAWVQLKWNGKIPEKNGQSLQDKTRLNSGYYEVVDKIWYRSGDNVKLNATSYTLLANQFTDSTGHQLSDHYPITADFSYRLNPDIQYGEIYGGSGGSNFTTRSSQENWIQKIGIRSGDRIDRLSITYDDGTQYAEGGTGGTERELILGKNEYIQSIEVAKAKKNSSSTERISYLKITTNLGRTLEGGMKADGTVWETPKGFRVSGFYGRSGDELDALGLIYHSIRP